MGLAICFQPLPLVAAYDHRLRAQQPGTVAKSASCRFEHYSVVFRKIHRACGDCFLLGFVEPRSLSALDLFDTLAVEYLQELPVQVLKTRNHIIFSNRLVSGGIQGLGKRVIHLDEIPEDPARNILEHKVITVLGKLGNQLGNPLISFFTLAGPGFEERLQLI